MDEGFVGVGAGARVLLAARRGRHARVHARFGSGVYRCHHGQELSRSKRQALSAAGVSNTSDWRWCGSNFDALGNLRFKSAEFYSPSFDNELKYLDRQDIAEWDTYIEDINWGYTKFDNFGYAVVTIFQSITLEGWSDIMFFCQDGVSIGTASMYFVVMVLFGGFFALNLVLAVLGGGDERRNRGEGGAREGGEEKAEHEAEIRRQHAEKSDADFHAQRLASMGGDGALKSVGMTVDMLIAIEMSEQRREERAKERGSKDELSKDEEEEEVVDEEVALTRFAEFVEGPEVTLVFTLFIVINTLVLAMDRYPISLKQQDDLDITNFVFALIFIFEMVLKIAALGVRGYCVSDFNKFDGVVVLLSIVELIVAPPPFLSGKEATNSPLSSLRTFRLFRVFKLARSWEAMSRLLKLILQTCADIFYFALLLALFMYIYSLLGMQFFANRLRFDDFGYPKRPGDEGYEDAEVPRAHYDTLLWSFTTIFQILSGENWNANMYDGWRAAGPIAVLYYVSLITLGMFIVMNLFIAFALQLWLRQAPRRRGRRGRRRDRGRRGRCVRGDGRVR